MPRKSFHLRVIWAHRFSGKPARLLPRMRGIAAITSFTVLAAGLIVVGSLRADTQSFSNATAITIPDSGAGTPYPSVINVSGMAGTINNVTLVLRNLTHSYRSEEYTSEL